MSISDNMRMLSVYRRLLCVFAIFWIFTLAFLYVYFNDLSSWSKRNQEEANTDNLGAESVDEPLFNDGNSTNIQARARRPPALGSHRGYGSVKQSIIINMVAPHMVRKHNRLAEYCNLPNKEVSGQEGRPSDGEDHELMSVFVFIRHGDRSSFNKFKGQSETHISCVLNKPLMSNNKKIARFAMVMKAYANKPHPHSQFKNWALYPNNAICRSGDLTGIGVLQHIVLGDYMRRRYLKTLFSDQLKPEVDLAVMSTDTLRTYQSAVAFLYGFLPAFNLTSVKIIKARGNLCNDETSGVACHCPEAFTYNAAYEHFMSNHNRLDKGYQRVARRIADIYGISLTQVPLNAWTVLDPLMVDACHDLPVKCNHAGRCVDGRLLANIWSVHDEKRWAINHPNKFVQREAALVYYPLLTQLVGHMTQVMNGVPAPKFSLYSGHDVNLSGILAALGAFDGRWTRYAGRLAIEQYRHRARGTYHVRVLHDSLDITNQTSFCSNLQPQELCDVDRFQEFVRAGLLTDLFGEASYSSICNQRNGN